MLGKEQVKRLNVVVSSGTGEGTISQAWDICRRVRVIPPSESASYDLTISDADGHAIIKRTGQVGTISEILTISLGIAKTISISSASVDGTYAIKFDMH